MHCITGGDRERSPLQCCCVCLGQYLKHHLTDTHVHSVLFCDVVAEDAVQVLNASTGRMNIIKVFCVLNFCLWFFWVVWLPGQLCILKLVFSGCWFCYTQIAQCAQCVLTPSSAVRLSWLNNWWPTLSLCNQCSHLVFFYRETTSNKIELNTQLRP